MSKRAPASNGPMRWRRSHRFAAGLATLAPAALLALMVVAPRAALTQTLRQVSVDAAQPIGRIRSLQGVDGVPVERDAGQLGFQHGPNLVAQWRAAHVDLVRSYIWQTRLDTVDNEAGLFPRWDASAEDAASYNFTATDQLVAASRQAGADILFTLASAIPRNTRPPADLGKYAQVVRHIAMHYQLGWDQGFVGAIRYWEIGDEPDLNTFHFSGTPEQFYEMYEAAARAIKSVDPTLQVGGPGLAFPLNQPAPYRDGFLQRAHQRSLPFDFFSWKWFSDATEDPYDFVRVSQVTTRLLVDAGLAGTAQFIPDWNFDAIPTSRPDAMRKAAFECAALIYMQDTPITRALLFRGDAAMGTVDNPDADLPTRMFNADGSPQKSGWAFGAVGRMLETPERLRVRGADDKGFAVLAGRSTDTQTIQILLTNYAIPDAYLAPDARRSLDWDLPVASTRVHVSMTLPPRRTDARQSNNAGYDLTVTGLPAGDFTVERYRLDTSHDLSFVDSTRQRGPQLHLSAQLSEPSVELLVIHPLAAKARSTP